MSKFVIFTQVRNQYLNGNMVESKRQMAVNADHIISIYKAEEDRCVLCIFDYEESILVEGSLEEIVKLLNDLE